MTHTPPSTPCTSSPTSEAQTVAPERSPSATRDMALLLILTCAPSVWISVTTFASTHYGLPSGWTQPDWLRLLCVTGASAWLIALLTKRPVGEAGRLPMAACALTGAWGLIAYIPGPLQDLSPVVTAALAGWLCIEVANRHGLRLFSPRTADHGAGAALSTFGVFVTGWLSIRLTTQLLIHLPGSTVMSGTQSNALGWSSSLLFPVANIIFTSVIEEAVMVAAVCVLGRAARARPMTIYAISIGVRILAHAYFGLAAVAVAVVGTASVWLYQRYRRPAHLALGHCVVDVLPLALATLAS